ncbi:JAB domain-containing protein [Novosphingobium malaysiense]|uniref:JAB domain-containing protein n=1 Tax=Novosphingobium malaysiense TaxID=1348853 RepID=UPI0022B0DF8F|nr:JAB domain-containing protein [Novosphingobium malaysiense]
MPFRSRIKPLAAPLFEILVRSMGGLRHEVLLQVLYDESGRLCGHQVCGGSGLACVSVRYRDLFEHAFRIDASGFVLVHNHPSGDARPSAGDIRATRALGAVAQAMDMEFHDHLIVAGHAAVSMREAGLMA